ncbi:MAG: hypothetical protein CME36_15165 [unclassified Hahellaceae]|nr:hypothetical protein [Hahellaceae bacterium]
MSLAFIISMVGACGDDASDPSDEQLEKIGVLHSDFITEGSVVDAQYTQDDMVLVSHRLEGADEISTTLFSSDENLVDGRMVMNRSTEQSGLIYSCIEDVEIGSIYRPVTTIISEEEFVEAQPGAPFKMESVSDCNVSGDFLVVKVLKQPDSCGHFRCEGGGHSIYFVNVEDPALPRVTDFQTYPLLSVETMERVELSSLGEGEFYGVVYKDFTRETDQLLYYYPQSALREEIDFPYSVVDMDYQGAGSRVAVAVLRGNEVATFDISDRRNPLILDRLTIPPLKVCSPATEDNCLVGAIEDQSNIVVRDVSAFLYSDASKAILVLDIADPSSIKLKSMLNAPSVTRIFDANSDGSRLMAVDTTGKLNVYRLD